MREPYEDTLPTRMTPEQFVSWLFKVFDKTGPLGPSSGQWVEIRDRHSQAFSHLVQDQLTGRKSGWVDFGALSEAQLKLWSQKLAADIDHQVFKGTLALDKPEKTVIIRTSPDRCDIRFRPRGR